MEFLNPIAFYGLLALPLLLVPYLNWRKSPERPLLHPMLREPSPASNPMISERVPLTITNPSGNWRQSKDTIACIFSPTIPSAVNRERRESFHWDNPKTIWRLLRFKSDVRRWRIPD